MDTKLIQRQRRILLAFVILAGLGFIALAWLAASQPRQEQPVILATPAAELQPVGVPGNWTLVFADEFDTVGLNRAVWYPNAVWYNCTTGGRTDQGTSAKAWWMCSQVQQPGDGMLHLVAEKKANPGGSAYPYVSGYVISGSSGSSPIQYGYGFFEARIKGPAMRGSWNQWWLWDSLVNKGETAEIDIAEFLEIEDPRVNTNLHTAANSNGGCNAPSTTHDWHTYAVDWQPGYIRWYVDGRLCRSWTGTAFNGKSLYMILGLQLGGTWAGPVDESKLPAEMLVDYVRVWRAGTGTPATATHTIAPPTVTRTPTLRPSVTPLPPTLQPSVTPVPPTLQPSVTPPPAATAECHWFASIGREICVQP